MTRSDRTYIRGVRKRTGLTLSEFAQLLCISPSYLSRLERRQTPISTNVLVTYRILLDIEVCVLLPDLKRDITQQAAERIDQMLLELNPVITRKQARKRDALEEIKRRCLY